MPGSGRRVPLGPGPTPRLPLPFEGSKRRSEAARRPVRPGAAGWTATGSRAARPAASPRWQGEQCPRRRARTGENPGRCPALGLACRAYQILDILLFVVRRVMDRPAPSTPARDPSMRPRRRRFDEAIALAARELRESTRLALPDAVILATA